MTGFLSLSAFFLATSTQYEQHTCPGATCPGIVLWQWADVTLPTLSANLRPLSF